MKREEKILDFWKKRDIFGKTLAKKSPKGEFIFYEGPPTANGRPGIHHLESRAFKDAIPRYRTMRGYHVRRKAGWDTHGLPVELEVEKQLGLKSKKEIESYGIAKFNAECKKSVLKYIDEWERFTDRIGFWVDQKDSYFTYQNSYIESLWSILGKVNEQGLIYKDYKVLPWCPRCGTALSSHELAQGYEEVKDLSLYVKFKIKNPEKIGFSGDVYMLAWTTTPWTLPGNVALAVGENTDYVFNRDQKLIYARTRGESLGFSNKNIENIKGATLVGLEYEPLYPFIKDKKPEGIEKAYKVYAADFVTIEDGTGIVHTAVMYGADDFELGTKVGLPKHHLVGEDGRFQKGTGFLEGRLVTETDIAVDILKDLERRGLFFKKESYTHSYPHCWRCGSKLIYFARDSWYIRMSAVRDKLISENKKINWEPAHTRDGRFGEWLREVKDWAISRERYWGTPLPVWETSDGSERFLATSIERLKEMTKRSGNRYFVMRHAEAESNGGGILDSEGNPANRLTERGKAQAKNAARLLKPKNISRIVTSPLIRAKETAEIMAKELSVPVSTEERLREIRFGEYDGKPVREYEAFFKDHDHFTEAPHGAETHNVLKRRVMETLSELEATYQNENILIVTHESGAWMLMVGAQGMMPKEGIAFWDRAGGHERKEILKNGEIQELPYVPFPHNDDWELDLHRPYIDEMVLMSESGKEMRRVREVMDVWFDSGGMPFAQDHYPFENKQYVDTVGYPADFICEAIDQTRGWFYTLHAVGVLMERGKAYKNVICLGHLVDKQGKKMSKSAGNAVEPWALIEKYGVDALRFWMYSVNQPGESKIFDEKNIGEVVKVFGLLSNVHSFYELYRDVSLEGNERPVSEHVLDRWIMARLDEVIAETTVSLDAFKLLEPTRAIRKFMDDLSTWYLRRSRERIKEGDRDAKRTLQYVLKTVAKLLAPFAPFTAEDIYQKLRTAGDVESVHLEAWPGGEEADKKVLEKMEATKEVVELALAARAEARIPVRQPLSSLTVSMQKEFFDGLVKDEVNVKSVIVNSLPSGLVELDVAITPALKKEGQLRELTRTIQELRKKSGLTPRDMAVLVVSADPEKEALVREFEPQLKKAALLRGIRFEKGKGELVTIDGIELVLSIKK